MSIPAVFAPVQQGDMILVDGGALNNIPVDVVKGMGADVVVAVSLDPPPPKAEDLQNIIGAASRSLSVMIADNERRSLRLADLTVSPDLKGLASMDFVKYEEFIDRGYKAAEARRRMLMTLQVSEEEYAAWKKARAEKRRDEKIRVDFIDVDDQLTSRRKEALVQALAPELNHPLDRDLLEAELSKVAGMGRYATANYTYVKKGAANGLRLFVTEKQHGPPFIKPGFTIDAIPGDGVRLGIGMRLTFLDVGGPASEWRSDFSIGVENRVATEYYYRIRGGKWFVAPRFLYEEVTYPYYVDSEKIAEFRNRYSIVNGDLGYAFGRFNEFRAGYAIGRRVSKVITGPIPIDPVDGRISFFRIRWAHEGQDSALIPRRGIYARTELRWVTDHPGVDRQFATAELHTAYAHTLGVRNVLIARADGAATASDGILNLEYALGGAMNMSAYARGQLLGSRYYHGGGYFLRTIQKDTAAELGKFFWMASYEMGTAWGAGQSALPRYSGSLGIMGDTAVGVVIFGAAVGDRGEKKVFFRLGKWF
jgi:NTE family protein